MAFSSQFESDYIRKFAGIVRSGVSHCGWKEWTQRIQDALSGIVDSKTRNEAQARFILIRNYAPILKEEGRGILVADELEKFADFVNKIK